MAQATTKTALDELVASSTGERGDVIPLLQKVQQRLGYLSEPAVEAIARRLRISESEIYGVATFYAQFRFTPPGEHSVRACVGTACHVRGGGKILDSICGDLNVEPGATTTDGQFDVDRVACLGCCALAPAVKIDETVHSHMSATKAREVINGYQRS